MLEFLKKTPQKEAAMISKRYLCATDYGKKTVILSCEPCPNGVIACECKGKQTEARLQACQFETRKHAAAAIPRQIRHLAARAL
jgi:hypothetical protein